MKTLRAALITVVAGSLAACTTNIESNGPKPVGPGTDSSNNTNGTTPLTYDTNGVAYVKIEGYRYLLDKERFDWSENFQGDSMRHDFENAPESNQCLVGYFMVDGPDDEEISAKLASGPHNDDNSEYADTYDLGLFNFGGTRARLRYEATHPDYDDGPEADINIGDVRGTWVGAMGCKLNFDSNKDGTFDTAKVLAFVDTSGFDASGKPQNKWQPTLDLSIPFADVQLKSPEEPYVATIGKPEISQATLRIDGQGGDYDYKFLAYRVLQPL
jgi:hypothetical protein